MKITCTKNTSKTALSLCKKISGFLAAVLLVVSLSAIGSHSAVNAVKLPSAKEGLVEILPEEWIAFWNAVDDARAIDVGATWRVSVELAMETTGNTAVWNIGNAAAWSALRRIEWSYDEDIPSSTMDAVWNSAFADAWRAPNGAAYNMVKEKDIGYFRYLVMVLRNQTEMLHDLVQRLHV